MTVASLGIAVDSSQAEKGAITLDRLTVSAQKAEAATKGVGTASTATAGAARQVVGAAEAEAAALTSVTAAANVNTRAMQVNGAAMRAANSNIAGMKFNTANLAAQFQDIAVSSQMGMGALQIGLQQGTQLAAVIAAMDNPIKGLGAAFASIISPVSVLVIGMTALVAGGLQLVHWASLAKSALNGIADVLQPIAPYATAAAGALALLYAPTIIGGIVQVIALLGRMSVAALTAAASLALANPAGAFIVGVTAAVAAANIFRDELTKIFGVDIVGVAKGAVNNVVAFFVGGYEGIKTAWSLLPKALGDVVFRAAQNILSAIQDTINAAIGGINKVIEFANKVPGVDLGNIGKVDLGSIANPFAGQADAAAGAISKAIKGAQGTDFVGNFTTAVSRGASTAAAKLRELANSFGTVDKAAQKAAAKAAEHYDKIVRGAEQFIAKQNLLRDTYGMTEEKANALRYEQELLNKAANDNIKLTAAQRQQLHGLAEGMAQAEAQTSRFKDIMDFAKGTVKGFFQDFRTGLSEGKGLWTSFADAASNALNRIADKLMDMAINNLWEAAFPGGGSSGGNFLSSIVSGLSGLFGGGVGAPLNILPSAMGNVFGGPGINAFSSQIVNRPTVFPMANGMGLMGEAGPEAVMPLKRDRNGRLGVSGGGAPVYNVTVAPQYVFHNADPGVEARLRQEIKQSSEKTKLETVQAVAKLHQNAPGSYLPRAS